MSLVDKIKETTVAQRATAAAVAATAVVVAATAVVTKKIVEKAND